MTSFSMPFFCVVKVNEAVLACLRTLSGADMSERCWSPVDSWTSPRVNRVVSDLASVHLPGHRREKNTMKIILVFVCGHLNFEGRYLAMSAMRRMTKLGLV